MKKHLPKSEFDIEWEKRMRYIDLMFKYMDIRGILWQEYPEKMRESTDSFAKKWLDAGLIRCKHENTVGANQTRELRERTDDHETRITKLESTINP